MFDKYHIRLVDASLSLENFLTLSKEEEDLKVQLEHLIDTYKKSKDMAVEALIKRIANQKLKMDSLIKIAENSPSLFNLIQHENLKELWQEAWRLMGANPISVKKTDKEEFHDMLPQKKITCISLLFGYFYYQKALKIRQITGKLYTGLELEYLKKAENHNSFHGLNALNKLDLKFLKLCERNKQHCPYVERIIQTAEIAANYHGTPGYLILAETYYSIAEYNHALNDDESVTLSLILCLQSLTSASLRMIESEAAINNAYFGQGLAASNPFKLDNIEDMKKLIITNAGTYLTQEDIQYADQVSGLFKEDSNLSPTLSHP